MLADLDRREEDVKEAARGREMEPVSLEMLAFSAQRYIPPHNIAYLSWAGRARGMLRLAGESLSGTRQVLEFPEERAEVGLASRRSALSFPMKQIGLD